MHLSGPVSGLSWIFSLLLKDITCRSCSSDVDFFLGEGGGENPLVLLLAFFIDSSKDIETNDSY